MPLRASVIIVNYDSWNAISRCLASLQGSIQSNDEVIVVDNASRGGEANKIQEAFSWVHLLCSPTNLGFGGGNNLGAKAAAGEYLAFLNPDTLVEPGWLDTLIETLQARPQAALATPKILLRQDPAHINACGNAIHLTGFTLCRGLGEPRHAYAVLEEVGAVSGAAFAMRKDFFMQLGGFDETYFMYLEDTDLSLRARLAGAVCLYVPQAIVYHDYSSHFNASKIFYLERNRYLMLFKIFHLPTLALLLPILLLAEAISWGFALLHGAWQGKLRTYPWLVKNWLLICSRRRITQASRQVSDRCLLTRHTARLDFDQSIRGPAPKAAAMIFNPLFQLNAWSLLGIVWW